MMVIDRGEGRRAWQRGWERAEGREIVTTFMINNEICGFHIGPKRPKMTDSGSKLSEMTDNHTAWNIS